MDPTSSLKQAKLLILGSSFQQTRSLVKDIPCPFLVENPGSNLIFFQDQWHTVMYRLHGGIRPGGKDHETCPVLIFPAAPCHEQSRGVLSVKCVLLLSEIPLIEPCGRNHNTAVTHTVAKQRLFHGRFAPGIKDHLPSLKSRKPPSLPSAIHAASPSRQNRRLLRGMNVLCRDSSDITHRLPPSPFIHIPKHPLDFSCRFLVHIISSAHKPLLKILSVLLPILPLMANFHSPPCLIPKEKDRNCQNHPSYFTTFRRKCLPLNQFPPR